MILDTEHFVKVIREIAQAEINPNVKEILKAHANNVDYALQLFETLPSLDNMRMLVATYTRAFKAVDLATPKVPTNDPSGAGELLEERRVA